MPSLVLAVFALSSPAVNAPFRRPAAPGHTSLTYRCVNRYGRGMKRTTLILEDACIDGVRDLARREGRQMSEVVNEILAEGLQRRKAKPRKALELPVFSMGRPRVNLGDRNALEALMDS